MRCDESLLPNDPQRCRVISQLGKWRIGLFGVRVAKIQLLWRAAARTAPVCNFQQRSFEGKIYNVRGEGQMQCLVCHRRQRMDNQQIFAGWFTKFAEHIVEERPLRLILDEHLSNVSLDVIS